MSIAFSLITDFSKILSIKGTQTTFYFSKFWNYLSKWFKFHTTQVEVEVEVVKNETTLLSNNITSRRILLQ